MTEQAAREATAPPASKPHYEHLTGLRGVAAVSVVLLHAWMTVHQGPDGSNGPQSPWVGWMRSGGYGVTVFIVLSGYSLMLGPTRHGARLPGGTWDFFVRRARRILPAYWIVLAVSILLGLTLLSDPREFVYSLTLPITALDVASHAVLLHDVIGNPSGINYVLWSMAVEWHIYFLMPLFLLAVRKAGALPMAVVTVVGTSLVVRATMNHTDIRLLNEFQLIGCFAIGVAACWLARNRPSPRPLMLGAGALVALWLALDWATYQGIAPGFLYRQSVDIVLACAVGLFLAAGPQALGSLPMRVLSWRPIVRVGLSSYSLYLLHPLVLSLLWNYGLCSLGVAPNVRLVMLICVGLAVTQAIAVLSYRHVEQRFDMRGGATRG